MTANNDTKEGKNTGIFWNEVKNKKEKSNKTIGTDKFEVISEWRES